MLTFFLNGKQITESELDADLTLLRYLRSNQNLKGTKEGCASGDCGACTVLVGEKPSVEPGLNNNKPRWQYYSANACILFMSQLEGKSVITVDALANGKDLHPAQQALVELHGSQCGFCTPGFIMSMACLYENTRQSGKSENISRQDVEVALSGNLCRCTGYRPIIDASMAMFDDSRFPHEHPVQVWQPERDKSNDDSSELTTSKGLNTSHSQSWVPKDEETLKAILETHPDAMLVAGATDLALQVTQQHQGINKLVSINDIASLKTIEITDDTLAIGAATPYSQVESLFEEHYPEFASMLMRLGSRQIRNNGTLGGNIANASPIGDTPPVLIALGASITLASTSGERTIPLETFFIDYKVTQLKPGEYIQTIHIPRLKPNERLKVYKLSKRLEDDISAVLFAAKVTLQDGQITTIKTGFGGMAAIPRSSPSIEEALTGKPLSEQSFVDAAEMIERDFSPLDDVRASAWYRIHSAKGLIHKCGLELVEPEPLSRVEQIHHVNISNSSGNTVFENKAIGKEV